MEGVHLYHVQNFVHIISELFSFFFGQGMLISEDTFGLLLL